MPNGPFAKVAPASTLQDSARADLGDLRGLPFGVVNDWNPRTIAVYDMDPTEHDMLFTRQDELVSPNLRGVLENVAGDQIQFLPVRLQSLDGEIEFNGYSLLHSLLKLPISDAQVDARQFLVFRVPGERGLRVSQSVLALMGSEGITGIRIS